VLLEFAVPALLFLKEFGALAVGRRLLNDNRDLASIAVGECHPRYLRKIVLLTELPTFPGLK
jgi:hypothetical protein